MGGVELPAPALLRADAALAEALHRSGAMDAFRVPRNFVPSRYRGLGRGLTHYTPRRRVYEGPEVCLEVGLWEAAEALALEQSAGSDPGAPSHVGGAAVTVTSL
ncbi:hypothetical protein GSI_12339 [Ganoderma sinense ZZ0214-1]|uniref:Uncharacterized protein n=1 Tax=Ganoderma sinense ZZ0214-1 TaxID=1077348 RepID=A0A2G8RYI8_9APHY|nr:hypothetical protein GSI_12339 [Ganoderma sinense ZZ0214-1]